MWMKLMLKPAEEADRVTLSPKQTDWLNQVHSCQDLLCVCQHDSTKTDYKKKMKVRYANDSIERADYEMDRMNADKNAWRRWAKRHHHHIQKMCFFLLDP
uniref:Uncharacterized protein n=1 Tax=Plectus sambesii TaxID=2011161 RepID=A0A914WMA3_9BILA